MMTGPQTSGVHYLEMCDIEGMGILATELAIGITMK